MALVAVLIFITEVLISTAHLLLMLEEQQNRILENSGQALIFGTYSDYAA
jgi:hypothetical protein